MRKPNTLLVMTDEQRFDGVGYRNREVTTPNLDKLQKDSMDFAGACTSNPSCVPARAAIFTGRYPSQYGVPGYMAVLPERETTFMSLLQEGGYHTAVVGKQHFWNSRIVGGYNYEDIVNEYEPPEVISPEMGEDYFRLPANKATAPTVSNYVKYLYDHGFRRGRELHRQVSERGIYEFSGDEKFYMDTYIRNRGLKQLEKRRPEHQPWFLTLPFPSPHTPSDGLGLPDSPVYGVEDLNVSDTTIADLFGKPPCYLDIVKKYEQVGLAKHGSPDGFTQDRIRLMKKAYYSNITPIDRKIGEVIKKLKELRLYDDIMIIFTSNHGDFIGDFEIASKAQYPSEALMWIPFLLKPPVSGFKGYGGPSFVSSVEIAATCLTTAELPVPSRTQDRSLTYFSNKKNPMPKGTTIYMEARDIRAIRDDRYKLTYYTDRSYGKLYDLRVDLVEKYNLWNEPLLRQEKNRPMGLLMDEIISLNENVDAGWHPTAPPIQYKKYGFSP